MYCYIKYCNLIDIINAVIYLGETGRLTILDQIMSYDT